MEDRFRAPKFRIPVAQKIMLRWIASIGSMLVAGAIRLVLDPVIGDRHVYTLFFAALAFTAWYAGFWPSIVALLVAYLIADWVFVTPRFEFDFQNYTFQDLVGLAGFLASGLAIAFTTRALHAARERAEMQQAELRREIQIRERTQKELEAARAELQRQAVRLEQQVIERTSDLLETIHSLEGICYHLVHDLRAPLRAMEGYNKIMLQTPGTLSDTARPYAQQVCDAAARMDYLILCLQDYGRLGHQKLITRGLELSQEVLAALSALTPQVKSSGAEVEIAGPLPAVNADSELLQQILRHLLSNAIKFVAAGAVPRIQIRGEEKEDMVRLWIEDNGIGIAPEFHQKIFRIFERLHRDEARLGSGIGLAVVAKAVARLGGRVGVESALGQGSRFWVDLPSAARESRTDFGPAEKGGRRAVASY